MKNDKKVIVVAFVVGRYQMDYYTYTGGLRPKTFENNKMETEKSCFAWLGTTYVRVHLWVG